MDKSNNIDPTHNVLNLFELNTKRLDDLIVAGFKGMDTKLEAEVRRIDEKIKLQSESSVLLNVAEAKRIDAIRAVDVNAVSVANEKATAQAVVLANQVAASAETLRALVAATAATTAQQLTQLTTQLTDRLTSLEKAQYEGAGKQSGGKDTWVWLIAGIGALIAIVSFIIPYLK